MDGGSKINLARFRDKYFGEREREGEKEKFFSKIESYIYKKKCVNKG